jgi:hypothetical protein
MMGKCSPEQVLDSEYMFGPCEAAGVPSSAATPVSIPLAMSNWLASSQPCQHWHAIFILVLVVVILIGV